MKTRIVLLLITGISLSSPTEALDPSSFLKIGKWVSSQSTKSSPIRITFRNTSKMGDFGENVTDIVMKKDGYTKIGILEKFGIDGIFVKYSKSGDIKEVVIAETKTKNSNTSWPSFPPQDNPGQMSTEWIVENIRKQMNHPNIDSHEHEILKKIYSELIVPQGSFTISRQLFRHDIQKNESVRYILDGQSPVQNSKLILPPQYLEKQIKKSCKNDVVECQ